MLKRIIVLAVVVGAFTFVQSSTAAVVSRFTFSPSGFFGNVNVCTGDILTFEGQVLETVTVTRAATNFQVTIHQVAQRVTATGSSGTRYVVSLSSLFSTHLTSGEEFTRIQRAQFVSLGPKPDAVFFLTIHYTIRPDGTVAVEFENERFVCRG